MKEKIMKVLEENALDGLYFHVLVTWKKKKKLKHYISKYPF